MTTRCELALLIANDIHCLIEEAHSNAIGKKQDFYLEWSNYDGLDLLDGFNGLV